MLISLSLFVLCDDGIVTGRSCDEATFTCSLVVEVLPIRLAEETVAATFAASVLHRGTQ